MWFMIIFSLMVAVSIPGCVARGHIFTYAGESWTGAGIPVVKFYTYGKIAGARIFGLAEGIFSLASKWFLFQLLPGSLFSAIGETIGRMVLLPFHVFAPGWINTVQEAQMGVNYDLLIGLALRAVQLLFRAIVRYRFDERYQLRPATLVLWLLFPHITEIMLMRKIETGSMEPEDSVVADISFDKKDPDKEF